MSINQELTHFSADGRARMVDVSQKDSTQRTTVASGILRMQSATLTRIHAGRIAKGTLLAVADIAAVMAAKETSRLITMCHSLALSGVEIEIKRRACAKPPRCRLEDGPIAIVTDIDEVYPDLPHFALDEMTGVADFILSPRPR